MTAQEILSTLVDFDGHGCGLDADLLDGKHASQFSLSSHTHTNLSPLIHSHDVASSTVAGFMSANDRIKLDALPTSFPGTVTGEYLGSNFIQTINLTFTPKAVLVYKIDGSESGLALLNKPAAGEIRNILEIGINSFTVANNYGHGLNETNVNYRFIAFEQ